MEIEKQEKVYLLRRLHLASINGILANELIATIKINYKVMTIFKI
jgi:hypothetical protein